jgi:hypothetical protein
MRTIDFEKTVPGYFGELCTVPYWYTVLFDCLAYTVSQVYDRDSDI